MDMERTLDPLDAVVLDPHPIWLDAIEMVLERIGATVVLKTSSSGEALAAIERLQPQLLILELDSLPGEPDGFEVMRRAEDARAGAPCDRALGPPRHGAHRRRARGRRRRLRRQDRASRRRRVRRAPGVRPLGLPRRAGPRPVGEPPARQAQVARRRAPGGLTRRELEILRLVAEGHSNSQLARMLWVTEQTVKFHLSNIYRKLDVANRTEASRWAQMQRPARRRAEPCLRRAAASRANS